MSNDSLDDEQGSAKRPPADFAGLRVAAFESRQAGEIARMITSCGGQPRVSPSLREVALDDHRSAIDFANLLITGQVDCVIFLTGVGFRQLLAVVERHVDRQRYLDALSDVVTVARGPKPVVAMREAGLTPRIRVPEPNTWRELLQTLDQQAPVKNLTVAVQEYGKPNPSLIAGLEARGARVMPVTVYRWELPVDVGPLRDNVEAIARGECDVLMFTSAHQVVNLLLVAEQMGLAEKVRGQFARMAVVSVGPTTSETLRDHEIDVDIEPEHPKMGPMVQAAARHAQETLRRKREAAATPSSPSSSSPPSSPFPRTAAEATRVTPPPTDSSAPWYNSPFMKACRREPVPYTPVWLMRQAGRYMAEYRSVRSKVSFLELCKNAALCAEVMVTAVDRLGVDAAIIFSDLLPILEPLGFDLEFAQGDGPVIHNPIREASDVDRVRELESMASLEFVVDTVRLTRAALAPSLPLIGFAGSPFTLASYALEGGSSRNYLHTKSLMYRDSGAWDALMGKLSRAVTLYLNAQIDAGAQCVQLFDSWVGCLSPADYQRFVLPYMQRIIGGLRPGVPVINFGTGNPALLPLLAAGGSSVVGIDWRVPLDEAWRTVGYDKAVQGNLDPAILHAPIPYIRERVQEVLRQAGGRPGHIFNLGHGILPTTPVDHAIATVDAVHELSRHV
jgi:uroporphyrinogen decarboxylase